MGAADVVDEAVLEGVDQAAEREIQVRLHLGEGTDDLPGVEAPCGGRGHGLQWEEAPFLLGYMTLKEYAR